MTHARYIIGDVREVLSDMPSASVDLVMTSPPFLALRSYLPADHPDKWREIGAEGSPGAFLDTLLDIVVDLRRVLAPHGSLVFELGDTYSGSGGAGGDYDDDGFRAGQPKFKAPSGYRDADSKTRRVATSEYGSRSVRAFPRDGRSTGGEGWPLPKSLCMIPHSFAWALAYGRNPWTGRELEPWRVRNLVAWCRPNPPVGALGDKFRPATSYLTVACTSGNRYFDLDAVRGEPVEPKTVRVYKASASKGISGGDTGNPDKPRLTANPAGAPPLDYWEIATQPYAGSHYASYPAQLCVRPIKAMTPQRVCTQCGAPSLRITERQSAGHSTYPHDGRGMRRLAKRDGFQRAPDNAVVETVGWTCCGCGEHETGDGIKSAADGSFEYGCDQSHWRTGVVLDPFAGSGTTLQVATGHGRDAIGIDIDERNADLALERVGPLLLSVERAGERHEPEKVAA